MSTTRERNLGCSFDGTHFSVDVFLNAHSHVFSLACNQPLKWLLDFQCERFVFDSELYFVSDSYP